MTQLAERIMVKNKQWSKEQTNSAMKEKLHKNRGKAKDSGCSAHGQMIK